MTRRLALLCASALVGLAASASAAPLVSANVDDSATVTVSGERSPLLAKARDLGEVAAAQTMPHVMLVLKRSPEQQRAFDLLVHDQQVRTSPSYHKWLAASQLRGFGPDEADVAKVVAWLQSHGLTVNEVSPSGMSIDFAGSSAAIAGAFHTSLHQVALANGETHIANVTDLAIPAALAPVVQGATLSNFFPKPNMIPRAKPANAPKAAARTISPQDDVGGYEAVTPQDFLTIYNVKPLQVITAVPAGQAPSSTAPGTITGQGVTVAVLEQTDIQAADWQTFRKAFGLDGFGGKLKQTHPACQDPGTTADEGEAALDAEWIGVAAPSATVIEASCAGTALTFGVETAMQRLVETGTDARVFSVSYGGPEQQSSPAFLAGWSNLVEEATSEGISVFISTGDSGVSYDRSDIASNGLAVNGLSSNPYDTAVGGTDFLDTYLGNNNNYWKPANGKFFESARSYVPETPWDNSCAGAVISRYGKYPDGLASCNDPNNPYTFQNGVGGTGGVSLVYAKPDYQNGVAGMPADGARDQPDVSLFASNGFWNHFLVLCNSDTNEGGTACDYTNQNDVFGNAAGGTSFAAPAFAGIAALVVQKDGAQGNMNPRLYALAQSQFSDPTLSTQCLAGIGKHGAPSCVFRPVNFGNIAEPCYATSGDCFSTKNATLGIGVLRNPATPHQDAYPGGKTYSLANGLGSVNVTNLVNNY